MNSNEICVYSILERALDAPSYLQVCLCTIDGLALLVKPLLTVPAERLIFMGCIIVVIGSAVFF